MELTSFLSGQEPVRRPLYFDPPSLALLASIPEKHQTGSQLSAQIQKTEIEVRYEVLRSHTTMKSGLTYEEMMKGLIGTDEGLHMNGKPLIYSGITFDTSPSGSGQPPRLYPGGMLLITNKRVIFMSCTYEEGAKLGKFGDPKNLPGGYSVQFKKQDFIRYMPIPLTGVKSAQLYASSLSETTQEIEGSGGGCLSFCFPKVWKLTRRFNNLINERNLILGIVMPPWEIRTDVTVAIDPNVSLIEVQNAIATLQKLCNL